MQTSPDYQTFDDRDKELAADETGLPLDNFPVNSPFTLAETLNPDFLPQD